MPVSNPQDIIKRALFQMLAANYPAQFSEADLVAQIARDPDEVVDAVGVRDALRDLQADRLARRHGRFWSASRTGIAAARLLDV